MNEILLHAAAALSAIWGIAHLFATRGVVAGFGDLTPDNRRIITTEWTVEGVALIATAAFVAAATATDSTSAVSLAVFILAVTSAKKLGSLQGQARASATGQAHVGRSDWSRG